MTKINLIMYCEEVYSLFSGEFSKSRFGGAGLQMYLLAEQFAKDPDIQVSFLFLNHDPSDLEHAAIQFITLPKMIQKGVPGISRLINASRRKRFLAADAPRTIFFSTMANKAQLSKDFASEFKTKSLLRVASDTDLTDPLPPQGVTKKQIIDSLKSLNQIVVQTEKQQHDAFNNLNIIAPVIKNGLLLKSVEPFVYEEREHILWVAGGIEVKQPHYFLDLAAAFPREKFVMLMPKSEVNQEMRGLKIRAESISNLELITEQKSLSEVDILFRKAKLFINTSAIEGFPNTFLQAAAAGTPIVSLSVNPDRVLDDFGIGISLEGNLWGFVETMRELLEDKIVWQTFSEAGPKYIKQERNIADSANEYKQVMLEVLGR